MLRNSIHMFRSAGIVSNSLCCCSWPEESEKYLQSTAKSCSNQFAQTLLPSSGSQMASQNHQNMRSATP